MRELLRNLIGYSKAIIKQSLEKLKMRIIKALLSHPYVLIGLIFVFWFIGTFLAIVFMSSQILSTISNLFNDFTSKIIGTFLGRDRQVAYNIDKTSNQLLTYIRQKGTALYNDGYIFNKSDRNDTNNDQSYDDSDGVVVNENNEVIKSNYKGPIMQYVLLNTQNYMVQGTTKSNKVNLSGLASLFTDTTADKNLGRGLFKFQNSIKTGNVDVEVDKAQDAMIIKRYGLDIFTPDVFSFDIAGVEGQYAISSQLLFALQKGIGSPDYILKLAQYSTKENEEKKDLKAKAEILIKTETTTADTMVQYTPHKAHTVFYGQILRQDKKKIQAYNPETGKMETREITIYTPLRQLEKKEIEHPTKKYFVEWRGSKYYINEGMGGIKFKNFFTKAGRVKDVVEKAVDFKEPQWFMTDERKAVAVRVGMPIVGLNVKEEYKWTDEEMQAIDELVKLLKKAVKKGQAYEYPIFQSSKNHWYRDIYFKDIKDGKYAPYDLEYYVKTGELWLKRKVKEEKRTNKFGTTEVKEIAEIEQKQADANWSAYKDKDGKEKRGTQRIEFSLDPKAPELKENKKQIETIVKGLGKGRFVVVTTAKNVLKQQSDARRGMVNERTKEILGKRYFFYPSDPKVADNVNSKRNKEAYLEPMEGSEDKKALITQEESLLSASETLENSYGLTSEYSLKDLNELITELNKYKREELKDPVKPILQWPAKIAKSGTSFPGGKYTRNSNEMGVVIKSAEFLKSKQSELGFKDSGKELEGDVLGNVDLDEDTKRENQVYSNRQSVGFEMKKREGTGLAQGEEILSPVTGKIIKTEGNSITIRALNQKDSIPAQYKPFYDDEYYGRIAGYEIKLEGLSPQSGGKNYYRIGANEYGLNKLGDPENVKKALEIERNKEKLPARIGDFVKEGTVIGTFTGKELKITAKNLDNAYAERIGDYIKARPETYRYEPLGNDADTRAITGAPNLLDPTDIEHIRAFAQALTAANVGSSIVQSSKELLDMQKKYKVNAIFAAAVAQMESGGNPKIGGNNIFSVRGNGTSFKQYGSRQEAIDDFGKLITTSNYYYKNEKFTVREIAEFYTNPECDQKEQWINTVTKIMDKVASSLDKILKDLYKIEKRNLVHVKPDKVAKNLKCDSKDADTDYANFNMGDVAKVEKPQVNGFDPLNNDQYVNDKKNFKKLPIDPNLLGKGFNQDITQAVVQGSYKVYDKNGNLIKFNPFAQGQSRYDVGWCTWYVDQRLKGAGINVPMNMGNGADWLQNAANAGYKISNTPQAGMVLSMAAGIEEFNTHSTAGHVAYVEKVNPDGSVVLSEGGRVYGEGGSYYNTVYGRTLTPAQIARHNFKFIDFGQRGN